jgi:hypothetical protein
VTGWAAVIFSYSVAEVITHGVKNGVILYFYLISVSVYISANDIVMFILFTLNVHI